MDGTVPSTYIVCDRDTAWPPGGQAGFAATAQPHRPAIIFGSVN
jgi:hypothetical protein